MWLAVLAGAFLLLEALAVYFSWRAIKHARTPQGSVGWVVFLIAAPYLAVPVYLFLGHHKYTGYINARRDNREIRHAITDWGARNAPTTHHADLPPRVYEQIADLPAIRGNDMRFLIDGEETFKVIFDAIEAARDYVLVQYYIVRNDALGNELKDRLAAAARRGVSVRMLVDAVGSHNLPRTYFAELTAAGVEIVDPRSVRGPKTRFQLNFRNHRKTVVVDGTTGFTGGLNVGVEYLGQDPKFGDWRDTHARFEGPIVSQLQLVFAEDWIWATGDNILEHLKWDVPLQARDQTALLVPTGPEIPSKPGR